MALNLCDPETVFKFHQVNSVLNSVEMVSTHLEPAESDVAGPLECGNFDQVESFSVTDSSKPLKGREMKSLVFVACRFCSQDILSCFDKR